MPDCTFKIRHVETCIVPLFSGTKAWGSKSYSIILREQERPDFLPLGEEDDVEIEVDDGKIASIGMSITGQSGQDAAFASLKKKFGKPTKITKPVFENAFGVKFQGINAAWLIGDITVKFAGIDGTADHGYIIVSTTEHDRIHDRWKASNTHNDL